MKRKRVLIRGGGDLASGVAAALYRAGWQVVICELPNPLAVRRKVSFSEAVYEEAVFIEGIPGIFIKDMSQIDEILQHNKIAVVVDPVLSILQTIKFFSLIDARLLKLPLIEDNPSDLPVIGLGPGFEGGNNCVAVIETNRGPSLGKIIWSGKPEENTGEPGFVNEISFDRVLYAPVEGCVQLFAEIGEFVQKGQTIARIENEEIRSKTNGVIRGLIRGNLVVKKGTKIADIDPRGEVERCYNISDKANIIGRSVTIVLETIYQNYLE